MTSTFHGLETGKRAMFTQQSALYTTGNNIANANTPGYTRQRVNFKESEAYPPAAMNRPQIPGQMGTGVAAGSIQRVREGFLDTQFRAENSKLGYHGSNSSALAKLEDILNETGKDSNGISKVLNNFWQSLQDLSTSPENGGARAVVIEQGKAVADTFNYVHGTIEAYRQDLGSQIEVDQKHINTLLENIDALNKKIAEVEPHGYLPNNLYDERDRLVDELSGYIDIKVEKVPSADDMLGNVKGVAEGYYIIKLGGNEIVNKDGYKTLDIQKAGDPGKEYVTTISFGEFTYTAATLPQGKMKSMIENFGHGSEGNGTYSKLLADLDKLANDFAASVNAAHQEGKLADGSNGVPLFQENAGASGIYMVETDPAKLAPSSTGSAGDGSNARNMADSFKGVMKGFESITGQLGVQAQFANRQKASTDVLRSAVEESRLSVSTVSLDEEMMNMIKYQHAYNAAARNITVVDEMLDKIINGMGTVGR
ncbi:MAG TPA: flagellar hook-associated protein FlgK [Bacillaceae bacterium]